MAVVMGTEAVGCSAQMLQAADVRVYLPLHGFADSLNLSVATALVVQKLLMEFPCYVGNMEECERHQLRTVWFPKLASQRLLSKTEKKTRARLIKNIESLERLQATQESGQALTASQLEKLFQLPTLKEELQVQEAQLLQRATAVVQPLIQNPPAKLTDLRRANLHRVTFAGKGTKKQNADHWKNMATVQAQEAAPFMSSAAFFRQDPSS